jgi:hypothetical protein
MAAIVGLIALVLASGGFVFFVRSRRRRGAAQPQREAW